ncbi:MAG: phytanoyl-CoA dioxygenase family protein [Phycisphaeraceae bacterium]|nr:phytanoyl-CoA dioxygenase family protein [Phycisphaeraceae bacterium]
MKNHKQALEQYRLKGWAVVEDVFSRAEAEGIAELALSHVSNHTIPGNAQLEPRKVDSPFLADERFRQFVLDPRMIELVRLFLNGREPLLATDQIFLKPPRQGSAKPYHQDNAYFRCEPAECLVTAWIALDDVDESNGCLRYIDGSQNQPILPHARVPGQQWNLTPDPALIDLSRESLAPVGKGGVVFHHGNVLHTSHRNESDRWRRAYASHWVCPEVRSNSEWLNQCYFNRSDYPRSTVTGTSKMSKAT